MGLRGWVNSILRAFAVFCRFFWGGVCSFFPYTVLWDLCVCIHVLKVTQANMCQDTINYKWFGVLVTNSFNLKVTQTNNRKPDSVWVNKHK